MNSVVSRVAQRQLPAMKWMALQRAGILSGPPRVHISKPEKFVSGVLLALGIVMVPAYILVNVKHYRARGE